MGYIRHHAIVVTGSNSYNAKQGKGEFDKVHTKAKKIFGNMVSEIIASDVNGYLSFLIAPDGSKEGWPDSNEGDERRAQFVEYMKKNNPCDYVEVMYGDDEHQCFVENHN